MRARMAAPVAPAEPTATATVGLPEFADSFRLTPEVNADANLGSRSVWRIRNGEDAARILGSFVAWCSAHRGVAPPEYAPVNAAADKYLAEREAGRATSHPLFISSRVCLAAADGQPIAGGPCSVHGWSTPHLLISQKAV